MHTAEVVEAILEPWNITQACVTGLIALLSFDEYCPCSNTWSPTDPSHKDDDSKMQAQYVFRDRVGRAKLVCATEGSWLAHSQLLDKYMLALKGRCLFYFRVEGRLVNNEWVHCQHMEAFSHRFERFKRAFHFESLHTVTYTACYKPGIGTERAWATMWATPSERKKLECLAPSSSSFLYTAFGNC